MKLDELMKKYGFLLDEEGRYYRINERGKREEPVAHIKTLAEAFDLYEKPISDRLKSVRLQAYLLRNKQNRIFRYYNINDARKCCLDLFEEAFPKAEQNGIFNIEGQEYTTIGRMAIIFGIQDITIVKRIKRAELTQKKGRTTNGKPHPIYNIKEVESACADILEKLPTVDDEGTVTINAQKYAGISQLAKKWGYPVATVGKRLKSANVTLSKARSTMGQTIEVYHINEAEKACADLLSDFPKTNQDGVAIVDGQKYASLHYLEKLLKISEPTLLSKAKKAKVAVIKARKPRGHRVRIYHVSQITQACQEHLEELPLADSRGIVKINAEEYTTITGLAKIFKISPNTFVDLLKVRHLPTITIRLTSRNIVAAYKISDIEKLLADKKTILNPAET